MRTPWGPSQIVDTIATGIKHVSTAGHGGYALDWKRFQRMSEALRPCGEMWEGYFWFEEDCAWAAVWLAFPLDLVKHHDAVKDWPNKPDSAKVLEQARQTLKNWNPDEFEAFYGVELTPSQSYIRDNPLPKRRAVP